MSELPSDRLNYRTVVAEYWLGHRGAGLLLSPLDLELVAEWEARGLPLPIVCRGIRRGFEEHAASRGPHAPPPRALRQLRGSVEAEWRAYRAARVGDAPPPPPEQDAARQRAAAARELLSSAARGSPPWLAAAYAAAGRAFDAALAAAPPAVDLDLVERAIRAADAALIGAWLGAMERSERSALGPRLALRAGPRRAAVRRESHRESLRTHLLDAAREAGVLCLRGSV